MSRTSYSTGIFCIDSSAADEFVDFTLAEHYSKMYSKCLIELAERALKRMKDDKGTILFISSPGCNITQTPKPGYDMPGKLEMVFCYQNCSDMLWEKIALMIEKKFWNSGLKAENLQTFWDH